MKHHKRSPVILSLAILLSLALSMGICGQPAQASGFSAHISNAIHSFEEEKVVSADGAEKDGFGYSVAISDDGSTALVGTYYIEFGITYPLGPGNVYAFIHNGNNWTFQQKLPATSTLEADEFGYSVAISSDGNTALIGAKGGDVGGNENQGTAYIFTRSGSTWSEQAQLKAPDGAAGDRFGISVALSDNGNTAMIGAYVDHIGANTDQGSAYIFERSGATWSPQAQITASDGVAEDYFGRSVALSGDGNTAMIGANMDKVGSNNKQGSAYIFTRSGASWSQQAQLNASDGGGYDWFGTCVAISGDGNTALAGAEGHMVGSNFSQGAAYIFTRSGTSWSQQAQLTALDGESSDKFGAAVALSSDGSKALIGVHWDLVSGEMTGSAYAFGRSGTTWSQIAHLTASDGAGNDNFGNSVALSADGSVVLIGADTADIGANSSQGAAYFYTEPVPDNFIFLPMVAR